MDEVKMYDPQELVAIPLTRDQWAEVLCSLKNDADKAYGLMIWWRDSCDSQQMGAETAARYERAYKELDALHAAIENILHEPWAPAPEPADEEE